MAEDILGIRCGKERKKEWQRLRRAAGLRYDTHLFNELLDALSPQIKDNFDVRNIRITLKQPKKNSKPVA